MKNRLTDFISNHSCFAEYTLFMVCKIPSLWYFPKEQPGATLQ
jgi:hypothetical protein